VPTLQTKRRTRRWLSLSLVVMAALPWSLSLGVMGLWLIAQEHQGMLGSRVIALSAGIAALSAGQLVFLITIGDRVFPRAHRLIVWTLEGGLGAIFLAAGGVCAGVSIFGLISG